MALDTPGRDPRRAYGYQPFGTPNVEEELVEWLRARAWVTAESSRALFARAGEFLIGRRILLPGWSTLWRHVGAARERADERGWTMPPRRSPPSNAGGSNGCSWSSPDGT